MWTALHGDPAALPLRERNVARMLFGGGPGSTYLRPLRSKAGPGTFEATIVADLKDASSRYPADPKLAAFVADLRKASKAFERIWTTVGTANLATDEKTISHPEVGDITVDCDVLLVPGADLRIVTYTATSGTSDAGKLDLLRVTAGKPILISAR
jgi:hypothetical protein